MTRVMGRAASATVRRAPSRAVERRARRHKVIMESVTQEKKKLRSVICFEAQAPSGYTFIPAGNPQLTTACKERCRNEGLQIHAVSTTPHHKTHNLSQHVHRIGYHFPSTVVAAVCSEQGLYLTSNGKTLPIYAMGRIETQTRAASEASQKTINTEARNTIRDLFPNIPDNDLSQIITTAFQKGQKKVGTATELPLPRRAQLAVVAHIRHVYTNYDRLLKTTSFHEARTTVEHPTLAKVIEWRGDDENGQTVLEDVFREVIVISDDEDSESEEDAVSIAGHQNTSVEILPIDARIHETRTQPISNAKSSQDFPRDLSEEAPPGFRFVTRVPANHYDNRRGFSRYQAWNRAIKEYREGIQGTEQPRFSGALAEKQSPRYTEKRTAAPETPPARRQDALPQHPEVHRRVIPGSASIDNQGQRMPTIPLMDRQVAKRHVGVQDNHIHLDAQQSSSAYKLNKTGLTTQESPELQVLEELCGPREIYRRAELAPGHRPQEQPQFRRDFMPMEQLSAVGYQRPVAYVSGQHGQDSRSVLDRQRVSGPQEHRSPNLVSGSSVIVSGGERTFRAPPAVSGPRNMNMVHLQDVPPLRVDPIPRTERLPHQLENRPNAPVFVSGPKEKPQNNLAPGRRPGVTSPQTRPGSNIQDSVVPSIEKNGWQPESWRADTAHPLVHMANRMSLRSVTPGRPQGELIHHADAIEKDSNGDQPNKKRRLASQGSRIDPRIARPTGFPVSEGFGPREIYRRAEPAPEHWHPYHDHNPRLDRIPSDQRGMRRNPMDGRIMPENPQDRSLYADGFVRPVDHREPPSFEYSSRRLAPEAKPKSMGDLSQPTRTRQRDIDYLGTKHISQSQVSSDQRGPLPINLRVARPDHLRAFSDSTAKTQPHASPPQVSRERPLSGGGFISSRHFYNPSSQAEQNRPVYVQRVEPQRTEPRQPYYSVPDGRHIVIVD